MVAILTFWIESMVVIQLFIAMKLFFIFIWAMLVGLAYGWGKSFCSMVCSTSCDGDTKDKCNKKCQTNWVVSGDTCIPNANLNWQIFQQTSDLGGDLAVTGATAGSTCGSMTYFGWVTPSATITVTSNPITVGYFQMYIYAAIISLDVKCWGSDGGCTNYWQSSTLINTQFSDPAVTDLANPFTTAISNPPAQSSNKCFNDKFSERYNRIQKLYTYNTTGTAMTWSFSNNEPNTTAKWGLREFIIIIRTCNVYCLTCYGAANTACYTCTNTSFQSNTTCSNSCLTQFGLQPGSNICIYCDLHCTSCYAAFDNCSACTKSGIYASYLFANDSTIPLMSCVTSCPDGYFANKTTRTCDLCNLNCSTCLNTATYCTSCVTTPFLMAWSAWTCYYPCPTHYYLESNLTNCTKCNPYCDTCADSPTSCTVCTSTGIYTAYLYNLSSLNGTCMRVCPSGTYGETFNSTGPNICLACDLNCTLCTGNPTPCTQCIAGLFLYAGVCNSSCPNGTFADNTTGKCLDCNVYCVGLTINMYFSNVLNNQMYIDMYFSLALNFTTFNYVGFQNITVTSDNIQYNLDMFQVTYSIINSNQYRIILTPKSYIFLYNATFTVTTEAQPATGEISAAGLPFKTTNYLKTAYLTWFLIKGPPFNSLETGIMTSFSTLSTKTNKILNMPYVQQIKKSGVFALLFSGAQITSCSILSNQIQSQNLYEGVRIWAIFVYFDAPPYQQISNSTKNFVSPTVQDKIRDAQQVANINQRALFSTNSMYWRFQRTGQTSFFIYDVYIPAFLLALCWIGMFVSFLAKKQKWYVPYTSKLYTAVHKIHQISIMYVTMASIVEFIYFQPTSSERIISAIVCVVFNIYFIIYELYIYYDMMRYPLAEIGNKTYDYYVLYYGFFLKNIRFEEYDIHQSWSPKHWLRPYNFHILSYYKKFVMMISLPLFYSTFYAQMSILASVQFIELLRFWYTWPFMSKKRNYFRLSLEISLLLFFIINIIQIYLLNTIMSSDASTLGDTINVFYNIGWAGFGLCFYFNVSFVVIGIYDLCVGLQTSNREKMDDNRKKYYYNKIKEFEKQNFSSSKSLVNKWVKLGNLNNRSYGDLPEVNIRIEQYTFKKMDNHFNLNIKKITSLKMKSRKNYRKDNNTTVGGKIQKSFLLTQSDNYRLYNILNEIYKKYEGPHVQTVSLKTFLNVWQKDYEEGADVPLDRNQMFQRVELISYENEKQGIQLQRMLEGFPLDSAILQNHL